MLRDTLNDLSKPSDEPLQTRIGDLSAMLRLMRPLNGQAPDAISGRRRLIADLCRFIGVKVGTLSPELFNSQSEPDKSVPPSIDTRKSATVELSPRQRQTLRHLLDGDSEKQVARKLELSQHTVHVYVKALYRRFGVSSRAELLSKHLKK